MAVIEVQGYLYDAKIRMAQIYEYTEQTDKVIRLRNEAQQLKEQFNQDFWMEDYFALDNQVQTITSDPGHCLWSGIIDEDKKQRVADKLLEEDLFSGQGIRTMSKDEKLYGPLSYHNGTVWPHDNSLIALGLARNGYKEHVNTLVQALFDSAEQFENHRLPELFCGYHNKMVPFPVACSPQAWKAPTPFVPSTTRNPGSEQNHNPFKTFPQETLLAMS